MAEFLCDATSKAFYFHLGHHTPDVDWIEVAYSYNGSHARRLARDDSEPERVRPGIRWACVGPEKGGLVSVDYQIDKISRCAVIFRNIHCALLHRVCKSH